MIKNRQAFVYRSSAPNNVEMDVAQIRSAFVGAESASSRLVEFRASRLSRLMEGDGAVPLPNLPTIVIHVLPLESFTPGYRSDLSKISQNNDTQALLVPGNYYGWRPRYTFDGFMQCAGNRDDPAITPFYALLFRMGRSKSWTVSKIKSTTRQSQRHQRRVRIAKIHSKYFTSDPTFGN